MKDSPFGTLGLCPELLKAVAESGFINPTPIQERSIPLLLQGRDLLGIAQTGTGKTAAFALPILQHLHHHPDEKAKVRRIRALILAPTRELAAQIGDQFRAFSQGMNQHVCVIFGGVSQDAQVRHIHRGVDVLIATPGRLLDLMQQGIIVLKWVQHFVLDEADRMLDMGFAPDVMRVIEKLPQEKRQSLLFSATMPAPIAKIADMLLTNPVRVEVTPEVVTVDKIEQSVFFIPTSLKRELLVEILNRPGLSKVIVFTRTKHGANKVCQVLEKAGISAFAIHGNKSQNARTKALEAFRTGGCRVLVATDIAARGIDVPLVSHVINFELPNEPESYVHRIGRTARAGQGGEAYSLCSEDEVQYLWDIEKLIRKKLTVKLGDAPVNPKQAAPKPQGSGGRNFRRGPRRGPKRPSGN